MSSSTTPMFRNRRPVPEGERRLSAEDWENQAPTGGTQLSTPEPVALPVVPKKPSVPWEGLDPTEEPERGFHVRVNAYEFALLDHLARLDDTSKQRLCRRVLRAYAEERLGLRPKAEQSQTGTG